jgi:hypothetical protein
MENLSRHIIRASFSQERMTYLDQGVSAKRSEATVQMVILTANPKPKLWISR